MNETSTVHRQPARNLLKGIGILAIITLNISPIVSLFANGREGLPWVMGTALAAAGIYVLFWRLGTRNRRDIEAVGKTLLYGGTWAYVILKLIELIFAYQSALVTLPVEMVCIIFSAVAVYSPVRQRRPSS